MPKIFGTEGDERNALLLIFVKDIAVWHFINLCNAGTDLQLRQDRYERAVAWLKSVQRSEIKPNLPVMEDADGDGKPNPERNISFPDTTPKGLVVTASAECTCPLHSDEGAKRCSSAVAVPVLVAVGTVYP